MYLLICLQTHVLRFLKSTFLYLNKTIYYDVKHNLPILVCCVLKNGYRSICNLQSLDYLRKPFVRKLDLDWNEIWTILNTTFGTL